MTDRPSKKPPVTYVSTPARFEKLARSPGGIDRENAVNAARAGLVAMQSSIDAYVDHELERIEQTMRQLTDGAPEAINRLYDSACNLRDTGSAAGFEILTAVAANLCDVVEAVQASTPYNRDIVMCHLAALQLSRHESYRGVGVQSAAELTSGLKKILEKITSASAAGPAADEDRLSGTN